MILASELAEVAAEIAAEYGTSVVFSRQQNGGAYNEASGKVEGAQPLTMTVKAVTEDKGKWVAGVVKGNKYLCFSAQGIAFAPEPGDVFTVSGEGFTVMDEGATAVEVEGVVVAYEVWGIRA